MEQPIIDPNDREEQLYYPPPNYIIENISPQEDKYFVDQTISSSNEEQNKLRWMSCLIRTIKITRTDISSFTLIDLPIVYISIILIVVFGALFSVSFLLNSKFDLESIIISGCVLLFIIIYSLCLSCKVHYKKYLTLEQNSIVLTKKALLSTKNIVYNYGELDRAEICYKNVPTGEGPSHRFIFYFVKKTGEREEFHSIGAPKPDVDLKGVKYCIDLLNQHIQKYMG